MQTIEVENLTKDYGFGRGVFDVSISVKPNEVFGFLGPNGAGKSTTIRHLMGFSKPDGGHTRLFGEETFDKYYDVLGRVGYIPGEVALPQGLTGRDFIDMETELRKRSGAKSVLLDEMLKKFELDDAVLRCETKRMSLGVKRKLAVVTAFMHDPEVLILDEPTSGLDPVMQERFVEYVHELKARGRTILLSSHIFSEIDSTCDRIAIIKDGRIVNQFVANELKHASRKFYDVKFATPAGKTDFETAIKKLDNADVLDDSGDNGLELAVDDKVLNDVITLLAKYGVTTMGNRRESLEDYFMRFYKEDRDYGGALK